MIVRRAQLEDTYQISALLRTHIERWQRLAADGRVEDVAYERLTLYEQWQHGGQWMNAYTATLWLSHLLRGAGVAYVVEVDAQIVAYAEVFPGAEPPPHGRHWHIGSLITHASHSDTRDLLLQTILRDAASAGRLTVNLFSYDEASIAFYERYGLAAVETLVRSEAKSQIGQGFYRAVDHPSADVSQIAEWGMPLGRVSSASQQWQLLWPGIWDAIPQIAHEPIQRVRLSASGQEAFLCARQDRYDPRVAEVYCWSNKPASAALLVAVRDWSHRAGYRTLVLWGHAELEKLIGSEVEQTAQRRIVLARRFS